MYAFDIFRLIVGKACSSRHSLLVRCFLWKAFDISVEVQSSYKFNKFKIPAAYKFENCPVHER